MLLFFSTLTFSQMIELSLKELSERSTNIIIAKPLTIEYFTKPGTQNIYTDITLEVLENFKGNLERTELIKVVQFGGVMNGIKSFVVGTPQFSIDSACLLFLKKKSSLKDGKKKFYVIGMAQGKYNIHIDNASREKTILREQIKTPLKFDKLLTENILISLT